MGTSATRLKTCEIGTGKGAAGTKVGPDHIHSQPGKLVICPDIELAFFALGWHLVREKTDLCPFFLSNLVRILLRTSLPITRGPV